jgi:hypothetical protein
MIIFGLTWFGMDDTWCFQFNGIVPSSLEGWQEVTSLSHHQSCVCVNWLCWWYNHTDDVVSSSTALAFVNMLCIENQHCALGFVNVFIANAAPTCFGTYVPSSGSVFVLVSTWKLRQLCTACGNVNLCVLCAGLRCCYRRLYIAALVFMYSWAQRPSLRMARRCWNM